MTFLPVLARWRGRRRTSSQQNATISSIDKISPDGLCALPMELWTHIFLHLKDDALFVVAAVCRQFNELSIHIILLTNGVAPFDMETGDYYIASRLLPVLLRALFIPAIENLTCLFEESTHAYHFRMLPVLVAPLADVDSVDMRFPPDPPRHWPLNFFRHSLFRIAMTPLLSRMPRDVLLVSEWNCLSSRDLFTYLRSSFELRHTTSLKLYFQPETDNLRPFTMLVLKRWTLNKCTTELHFNRFSIGSEYKDTSRLSTAQLGAVLSKITLPYLVKLEIVTSRVAPTTLEDFLIRNPQIEEIDDKRRTPSQRNPLLQRPLALPHLQDVRATTAKDLLSLLIVTAPSPPRTIGVTFRKKEPTACASLFRYLSRRNIPAELRIDYRWDKSFTERTLC